MDNAQRTADGRAIEPCAVCGLPLAVGEQGCIATIRPHEPVLTYRPFTPYFDFALGQQIDSHAQRWRVMRQKKLDYRDKMDKGTLSARRDRIEEERKERARR